MVIVGSQSALTWGCDDSSVKKSARIWCKVACPIVQAMEDLLGDLWSDPLGRNWTYWWQWLDIEKANLKCPSDLPYFKCVGGIIKKIKMMEKDIRMVDESNLLRARRQNTQNKQTTNNKRRRRRRRYHCSKEFGSVSWRWVLHHLEFHEAFSLASRKEAHLSIALRFITFLIFEVRSRF